MKAPSVRHPCETAAKGIDLAADSSGSVHDLSKCSQAQPRMAPHVNLLRWDGYDLRYPKLSTPMARGSIDQRESYARSIHATA